MRVRGETVDGYLRATALDKAYAIHNSLLETLVSRVPAGLGWHGCSPPTARCLQRIVHVVAAAQRRQHLDCIFDAGCSYHAAREVCDGILLLDSCCVMTCCRLHPRRSVPSMQDRFHVRTRDCCPSYGPFGKRWWSKLTMRRSLLMRR